MKRTSLSWFVYILENRLNQYYTGVTNDPKRRFTEHRSNGAKCAKALRGKQPLQILMCAEFTGKNKALSAEIYIKRLTKTQKEYFLTTNAVAQLEGFVALNDVVIFN